MTVQVQRVNGYLHKTWQELQSFPRDGGTVEICDSNGNVWLARWHNGLIYIDCDMSVEPTHWRPT